LALFGSFNSAAIASSAALMAASAGAFAVEHAIKAKQQAIVMVARIHRFDILPPGRRV
jgi:hypothetical protein